jgi:signal transduction histidine kinase
LLEVNILQPFWVAWWFWGIVVLAFAAAGAGAHLLRMRSIQARTRELEVQVASLTKELAALNAVAGAVSRTVDLQRIMEDALDKTLEIMGIEAGGIYLVQEEAQALTIVAHRGLSAQFVDEIDHLKVGEGFSGRVVQTGEPMVVRELPADPRLTRSVVTESGFCSVAITPILARGRILGTLFVITRDEAQLSAQDVDLLTAVGGQIGVAMENARFFVAEQRRAEQFRVIAEVGRRIALTLDMDEALEQLTRLIQQAFGYYHVGIGLIEGDDLVYRIGAGTLWDDPDFGFKPQRLKVGEEGLSGWVAARGELLLVLDVSQDPRYVWMEGSETKSELVVPIIVKGQLIGVLDAQSDRLNAFDDTDVAVLQSVAHQAGAAIENARLHEQAQQAAVVEERQRLARELHDAVTQTLFSASLIAEALPVAWETDRQEGQQLLRELRQLTRGALAEMRTLLLELRPGVLVEASLHDLLRQLAEAASGRMGMPVTATVEGECIVPADVQVALYRIAQEALNNVVKHARASRAEVNLCCTPSWTLGAGQHSIERPGPGEDSRAVEPTPQQAGGMAALQWAKVELQIQDDGRGFEPGKVSPDHLGLSIMRERAETISAQLLIESQAGHGTRVRVIWPGQGG